MQAIGKHILIKPIKEEIQTESGMFLSGEQVEKVRYKKGTIYKVGTLVDTKIKEGMTVHYDAVQSFEMVVQGENVSVIREVDVIVVL